MAPNIEPSPQRRQLGRTHLFGRENLPPRLLHWHAPRANRWERVCVQAGTLGVAWLDADGVTYETLPAGVARWIAPGTRWRIAQIDAHTRFAMEIHADEATAAAAPLPLRAALLDAANCATASDAESLTHQLAAIKPGSRLLVRGDFDFSAAMGAAIQASAGCLCWHPLDARPGRFVALVSRSAQAIDLLEYLGRDHAVIESALAGALHGDAERMRWLRTALARHLSIEEDILFPAYLVAGGNAGWVRGLRNEHAHLRRHLDHLDDPVSQRRFLLLLDGHDEKEEQLVYPDIIARLDSNVAVIGMRIMTMPAVRDEGLRRDLAY